MLALLTLSLEKIKSIIIIIIIIKAVADTLVFTRAIIFGPGFDPDG